MTLEESRPTRLSAAWIASSRGTVANFWEDVVPAILAFPDFQPEICGSTETDTFPFKGDDLGDWLYLLGRENELAYKMYLNTKRGIRGLTLETSGPLAGRYEQFFALSDALAAATQVEYGYIQPRWSAGQAGPKPRGKSVSNIHELQCDGPPGVCMRTWFGPHITALIGEERILGCGAETTRLPWGGFRIDIAPAPWTADVEALAEQLTRVEKALEQADVFGNSSVVPTVSGKNWVKIPRGDS